MATTNIADEHLPVCCYADALDSEEEDPHREALLSTICGFYVEALDRLPIHEHPGLFRSLYDSGHCYGLLEPVSNIILHTMTDRPSKGWSCYTREITDELMDKMHKSRYWLRPAERSLDGLVTFLMSFYRYLTQDQALRYLLLARADIHFAVDLIGREFDKHGPAAAPPWIPRVEDALTYAAMAAEHPEPERLVKLATTTFGAEHVDRIAAWLHGGGQEINDNKLSAAAVEDIYESLTCGGRREEGGGVYLYSLRVSYADDAPPAYQSNLEKMMMPCIHRCPSIMKEPLLLQQAAVSPTACDYIKRIEALLVDYIHTLHLSAISRVSPQALELLHHGLVVAGYMYGPLKDPVSNILVNAIWYWYQQQQPNLLPAEADDDPHPAKMICTDRMLRNGFNALTGQVAFLCSKYGTSSLSRNDAMQYLYFTNCNLRAAMDLAEEQAKHHGISSSSGDGGLSSAATEAAVEAMRHPKPAAMMALLASFTPELEAELYHLLPAKGQELSCADIDQISRLLSSYVALPIESPPAATMHQGALEEIAEKRSRFKRKERFLLESVQSLLDENYMVHAICDVARSDFHNMQIYHVNFLATRTTDDNDDDIGDSTTPVLFFAQILAGRFCWWKQDNWKKTVCCPVNISACLGRCFLCEFQRAKVVHPISVDVKYYGRQEKTYLDFKDYISSSPHTVYNYKMESDFVYFDPGVNTELAKYQNDCAKKREEMTEEEVYQALIDSIPC